VGPPYYASPYIDQRAKTFTLPISGSVILFGPEIDIIETPEFQRLGSIRQLGTAYLVYRGANHTRFEHSLGTLHRAEQMIRAVNENPRSTAFIDERGRRLSRLAALLHDLPHIPFGHTLEDELGLLQRHDYNDSRISELLTGSEIGTILRSGLGNSCSSSLDEYHELLEIMRAKSDEEISTLNRPYVADLVGDTVCADALDYIERDLTACGMPGTMGTRFLDFFTITQENCPEPIDCRRMALRMDKRGMPRPDVESEVVKLLSYRYELAERVYFHHAKNAASVMVGRAVVEAGFVPDFVSAERPAVDVYDKNFRWVSDELLLQALANPVIADQLGFHRDDRDSQRIELAAELASSILKRRLYKIAYLAVRDDLPLRSDELWKAYGNAPARRRLEDDLAASAGVNPGQVLVHIPNPKGLAKLATVRILTDQGRILTLEKWDRRHSGRFHALNVAHERLWRITVYVDPKIGSSREALVRAAAMDLFGASGRYRLGPKRAAYVDELFSQLADGRGWTVSDREALADPPAALSYSRDYRDMVEEIDTLIKLYRMRTARHGDSTSGLSQNDATT